MIDPSALSADKRAQILGGAATVFAEDGYERASMSRIALAANVSKGTLYNHFENKADLFSAYLGEACTRHLGHIFDGIDESGSLEQALCDIGRRMVALVLTPERRGLYRMAVSEAEEFPELARAFFDAGPGAAIAAMARWIGAEVARGRLAADSVEVAAQQFFALCHSWLGLRYRLFLDPDPTEAAIRDEVGNAVKTFLARYEVRG